MDISTAGINPHSSNSVSSIASNAAAPSGNGLQPNASPQASATVTLSTEGQKLNRAGTPAKQTEASQSQTLSTVDTVTAPNAVPQSKETTAAPGIQFMAGESKGGRVNTFA